MAACRDELHEVTAEPVEEVVDATGAGDAYAAGFLYGLARGCDLPTCGHLGAIPAARTSEGRAATVPPDALRSPSR
ncbi:MAG: PfkB family carbohydrate kinase [Streptosporangiaceae bacterium]